MLDKNGAWTRQSEAFRRGPERHLSKAKSQPRGYNSKQSRRQYRLGTS
jgi:hypothetical protein